MLRRRLMVIATTFCRCLRHTAHARRQMSPVTVHATPFEALVGGVRTANKSACGSASRRFEVWVAYRVLCVKCKSKNPPGFSDILSKQSGIFSPNFTRLLYVPIYTFLFNYLQLWRSYAILSVTIQFTSYAQNARQLHHSPCRAAWCLIRPAYSCAGACTYLFTYSQFAQGI